MAAEKMYSFTHLISETKLLAMISQHAEEVRIDIIQPEKRTYQRRLNGAPAPFMIEDQTSAKRAKGAKSEAPGAAQPPRKSTGAAGKKTGSQLALEYLADHKDRIVTSSELEKNALKHKKSKHAISVSVTGFLKKGWVERVGKAQYKILKEGLARVEAGFRAAGTPSKPSGRGKHIRKGTGTALIWAELVKGDPVARAGCEQIYKDHNLKPASLGNAFNSFVGRGLAKRLEAGVFQITPKGAELHAQQTQQAAQQPST